MMENYGCHLKKEREGDSLQQKLEFPRDSKLYAHFMLFDIFLFASLPALSVFFFQQIALGLRTVICGKSKD